MAVLGSRMMMWFRRCCDALGNPSGAPCTNPTPPNGSFDMKYYVEVTGTYVPGTWEDKYTNLKVHFWLVGEDHGYMAMCKSEDGKYKAGCTGADTLYYNYDPNSADWRKSYSWDSTRANYTKDIGTYSMKDITIKAGTAPVFNIAKSEICGKTEIFTLTFSKEIPDLSSCTKPTITLSCGPDTSSVYSGYVNIGGSWGENINKQGQNVTQTIQSWVVSPGGKTGSGSVISGLQPNTKYTITATKNNGCATASSTCSFTTLAGTTASNCRSDRPDQIKVDYTVLGGYGQYTPTTTLKYRKYGTSAWKTFTTTTSRSVFTMTYTGLEPETSYEFQACTKTTAGEYCGNIVMCRTAKATVATIDSAKSYFKGEDTLADICYSWEASCAPVKLEVFYRVKNGYDPTWIAAPVYNSNKATGSYCVTVDGLIPNATVYETFVRATGCDGVPVESGRGEFTTPIIEAVNYNCESLEYMLDLICQALERVKVGNKTIYANYETMKHCDPYSENPTLTTLWSRFFRWGAGAACLLCEMIDFILKSGKENQYFTGEIGWVDILDKVEDSYEDGGGERLVMSKAIRTYIDNKLHEVWHYHGAVDYILDDLKSVPSDAKIVLNLADNKIYEKSGSSWKVSTKITQPDDFSVYHVNYQSKTTTLGTVQAESAWYYWDGTWNNLDLNIDWMLKVLDDLYQRSQVSLLYNEEGKDTAHITVREYNKYSCEELVSMPERVVCFITEPTDMPEPVPHTIKFETGEGNAPIPDQIVLDGALIQFPNMAPQGCFDFAGWVDKDSPTTIIGRDTPIYKDYTLVATWERHTVEISFNIGDGIGNTPPEMTGKCGEAIGKLPDGSGFEPAECDLFVGWANDGVDVDETYILPRENIQLDAVYRRKTIHIVFDYMDDEQPNYEVDIECSQFPIAPEMPERKDHIFMGWYNDDKYTDPWEGDTPLYADHTFYAKWIPAYYTVTFNTDGGTPIDPQRVYYETTPVRPDDPTKEGYILREWRLNGEVYNFDIPVTEDITIDAIWAKVWMVTFDPAGGEPVPEVQLVPEGDVPNRPKPPTKSGYVLSGWYKKGEEAPLCDNPTKYRVIFDPNGGEPTPDSKWVWDGETVDEPDVEMKRDKFFLGGWYDAEEEEPTDCVKKEEEP